ncbi:MAG TPA: prepilin-type N-terminal cleavage/methylation domain-containing protein [Lacipirellula sp.]
MNRRNGFTLVELVVVILILGILAGVAAPKMFSTSNEATDNGLRQSLAVVRDAIELFYANNGDYPACSGTGADFRSALKSYIRGPFPTSPVGAGGVDVKVSTADPVVADGSTAWMYNADTGEFICNENSASASQTGNYSSF